MDSEDGELLQLCTNLCYRMRIRIHPDEMGARVVTVNGSMTPDKFIDWFKCKFPEWMSPKIEIPGMYIG